MTATKDATKDKPKATFHAAPVVNLTIPNVTADQQSAILAQIAGGAPPPTTPPDGDAIAMVRSAPSNWAAYTFCNSAEWAALDAMYGTEAVNNMKNYYQGNYRMPGLPNPGDPNTMLREIGYVGLIRYYVMMNGTSVEDVGQADAQQVQVCGKPQPKLPCHA